MGLLARRATRGQGDQGPLLARAWISRRSDDPTTWGTLSEAKRAAREKDLDGIGFVFTESDPFCGLHMLLRAVLPPGDNRRARIEMYDRGRFFTVSGRRLDGTSRVVEERQEQLSALHDRLFSSRERDVPERQGKVASDNGLDDDEVLRKATSAANGARFAALWAGDRSGYASDSEADLALCSMLAFWVGPDETRISSLFSRSGRSLRWSRTCVNLKQWSIVHAHRL